jgi:predicted DNA-binding transcriptional regulator AlpA
MKCTEAAMPIRPTEELWDWKQVARACGGDPPPSHSTIRRWCDNGLLPPSIAIGPGTMRWRATEVRAALKRRVCGKGWDKSKGKVQLPAPVAEPATKPKRLPPKRRTEDEAHTD